MFKRKIQIDLENYYKNTSEQKILIVYGARQVGKSYIIRNTAKSFFKNYAEIDLKDDYETNKLFSNVQTTKDFYTLVSSLLVVLIIATTQSFFLMRFSFIHIL